MMFNLVKAPKITPSTITCRRKLCTAGKETLFQVLRYILEFALQGLAPTIQLSDFSLIGFKMSFFHQPDATCGHRQQQSERFICDHRTKGVSSKSWKRVCTELSNFKTGNFKVKMD